MFPRPRELRWLMGEYVPVTGAGGNCIKVGGAALALDNRL